ncbi:TonB-dependent receptor domain-containing protein [Caulobacter segnis]
MPPSPATPISTSRRGAARAAIPRLEPWRADAYDVSYEKYFGRQAYISLAAFYKDLKTYVYDQSVVFDFTGFPTGGNPEPATRLGLVTTPQNGKGGVVKGVEFAASMPFSLLTPVLDGFGAQFSASYTESTIHPNPADEATLIPGLSKTVANLTVYYEKNGFSFRVSDRYRSKFLGEVSGFGNGRNYRMVKGGVGGRQPDRLHLQRWPDGRSFAAGPGQQPDQRALRDLSEQRPAPGHRLPELRPHLPGRPELQVLVASPNPQSLQRPCRIRPTGVLLAARASAPKAPPGRRRG